MKKLLIIIGILIAAFLLWNMNFIIGTYQGYRAVKFEELIKTGTVQQVEKQLEHRAKMWAKYSEDTNSLWIPVSPAMMVTAATMNPDPKMLEIVLENDIVYESAQNFKAGTASFYVFAALNKNGNAAKKMQILLDYDLDPHDHGKNGRYNTFTKLLQDYGNNLDYETQRFLIQHAN